MPGILRGTLSKQSGMKAMHSTNTGFLEKTQLSLAVFAGSVTQRSTAAAAEFLQKISLGANRFAR